MEKHKTKNIKDTLGDLKKEKKPIGRTYFIG